MSFGKMYIKYSCEEEGNELIPYPLGTGLEISQEELGSVIL